MANILIPVLGNHSNDNYNAFFSKTPVEPDSSTYAGINTTEAKKWVEAHEEKVRPALRMLVVHIDRISYKSFKAQLSKSVGDVRRQLSEKLAVSKSALKDRLIVLVEAGKSNQWVAELAAKHCKFECDAYYRLGVKDAREFIKHINQYTEEKGKKIFKDKVLVLFDDASYSGKQLNDHLDPLLKLIKDIDLAAVAVIVPYMTETAETLIKNNVDKKKLTNLFILSVHHTIPTVSSVMKENEDPLNVINTLWWDNEKLEEQGNSRGTIWFDHKVPNGMSFPEPIKFGTVRNDKQPCKQTFTLVPKVQEPYKS